MDGLVPSRARILQTLGAVFVPAYAQIWPHAKYIFAIRSGPNAVASQMGRGKMANRSENEALLEWVCYCYTALHTALKFGLDLHVFNYDSDISREQAKLREFLQLDIDIESGWQWKGGK